MKENIHSNTNCSLPLGRAGGESACSAVLFDMDGVLFDSMPGHAFAWLNAMQQYGLTMTREEVYMNEGRTGAGTINAVAQRTWGRDATDEEIQAIYRTKSQEFNRYFQSEEYLRRCAASGTVCQPGEAPVMPGAAEVLDKVRARGLQRILVTGSGQASLLDNLNRHFPGHFTPERMVTAYDVRRGKPDPEPYLMGLQKAGVEADQAIVVENAPLGIRAARAAGIRTIAVNTGPLSDAVLLQAGADIVLPSMQALAEHVDELLCC